MQMLLRDVQVEPRRARLLPFNHLGEALAYVFRTQRDNYGWVCGEQLETQKTQVEAKLCLEPYLNSCILSVEFFYF